MATRSAPSTRPATGTTPTRPTRAPGAADCRPIVDDLDAVRTPLDEEGIGVVEGPVPKPGARGPMTSVYVRDPEGTLVELATYDRDGDRGRRATLGGATRGDRPAAPAGTQDREDRRADGDRAAATRGSGSPKPALAARPATTTGPVVRPRKVVLVGSLGTPAR